MALLRRTLFLLLVLVGVPPAGAQEIPSPAPLEYEVKAVFLFNFAKFVEWPQDAFAGERSPLTICIYGADPFGKSLDSVVQDERLGERSLIVQRPTGVEELRDCHILFVSRSERQRLPDVISRVDRSPVLTVSEMDGFLRSGGIINFVLEENKVRFLINLEAAERNQLKISSKLLRLAMPGSGKGP